ncbi:hypothetical protein [Microtetraspora malaysiensis]|uniref:hypothetical protein n=1 Tax=Microtetraspora malaysiensis TaxID=161358 RepID=UPI003D89DC66
MTVIRTTRQVEPADVEELPARRAALVAAIRASFTGLAEARLTRLEDGAWADAWRWDSAEAMQAALAAGPTLPEAGLAFALTRDATAEVAELVDEL